MSVKKKKIIFVCTGNTCRSPMAEMLLKNECKIRAWKTFTVTSAGISVKRGSVIHPNTVAVLEEKGIAVESFKTKRLTEKMMKDAYAIVCMTESQREYLLDARWHALRKIGEEEIENNVYSFSEFTGYEILDPYGKDVDCYRYVFGLLAGGMSALTNKLGLQENDFVILFLVSEKIKK